MITCKKSSSGDQIIHSTFEEMSVCSDCSPNNVVMGEKQEIKMKKYYVYFDDEPRVKIILDEEEKAKTLCETRNSSYALTARVFVEAVGERGPGWQPWSYEEVEIISKKEE